MHAVYSTFLAERNITLFEITASHIDGREEKVTGVDSSMPIEEAMDLVTMKLKMKC